MAAELTAPARDIQVPTVARSDAFPTSCQTCWEPQKVPATLTSVLSERCCPYHGLYRESKDWKLGEPKDVALRAPRATCSAERKWTANGLPARTSAASGFDAREQSHLPIPVTADGALGPVRLGGRSSLDSTTAEG